MDISIFKKPTGTTQMIDVSTTYNLWNLLKARYDSIETTQMLKNFIHDKDLDLILENLLHNFQTQSEQLEKEAKKFKVGIPPRPAIDIKTSTRIDEITDKFIYKRISTDMVTELLSLSTAVRTTLTNDRMRNMFKDFLFSHLADLELLHKYGKLKGWEEIAPAYKTSQPVKAELLAVNEAFYLWRNINDRYIQSQLTDFFMGFAHDLEFTGLLTAGLKMLSKQIKTLENEALKYQVHLPQRPPASLATKIDPENLQDRFMYQIIFKGIDDSIDMHIRAVLNTQRNDSLRKLFLDLYKQELLTADRFIRYGKMKGWALVPPIYVEPI